MKEIRIGSVWVQYGFYKRSIGLGIFISSIQCSLDLLFFFVQIELPMSKRRLKKGKAFKNG
jgi:hypothetical protein